MNEVIKKRGRPKKIDRNKVIKKALKLYWEKGVENVSMTTIANSAKIPRVSLYDEFGGEKELLMECLNLYKEKFKMPLLLGIDESADLPSVLKILFFGLIYDGNFNWDELKFKISDSQDDILRPKFAPGCFYIRTKNMTNKLYETHQQYIYLYDHELERRLALCIETAKKNGIAFSHLDALKTAEFINSQLSLMQTLRSTKASEEKMIDTYKFILSVIMPKKYHL